MRKYLFEYQVRSPTSVPKPRHGSSRASMDVITNADGEVERVKVGAHVRRIRPVA